MIFKSSQLRLLLLAPVLAAIFMLAACSGESRTAAAPPETVRNLSVVSARQAEVPDLLEAVGTVRAAQSSDLASQMMGNILEIRIHEGDRVRKGEVLALIDPSHAQASVNQASAALLAAREQVAAANSELALAESTLKRYQNLYEKRSVSPQEFDEIKTRRQAALAQRDMAQAGEAQAKAALDQANTAFGYTRIRAPFEGIVTARKADAGTLASPGMPLFTVEDVSRYRLEASLNESDVRYVRLGEAALVVIDSLQDQPFRGKIAEIVPAADSASRSFLLKVELPADARLRSGLFGRAEFSRGQRQALLIPGSAVVRRGQLQGVFVLDSTRVASLHYITLGKPSGSEVEVLTGLQAGEPVVANPGGLDLNGKRVVGQ